MDNYRIVSRSGKAFWVGPDGKVLLRANGSPVPVVRGGSDAPPPPPPPPPPEPKPEDKPDPNKTFTQEDLTRIATREKQEGHKAGKKELLEKFGVETEEEVDEILKAHREGIEAAKTETQKDRDKAAKEKEDAEREKREATHDRLLAKVERRLIKAGVEDDNLTDVLKLVEFKDDSSDEDLDESVKLVKEKHPSMFTASGGTGPGPSDPGRRRGAPNAQTPKEQARSVLESRHPKVVQPNK